MMLFSNAYISVSNVELVDPLQIGQWVKVAINYGKELPEKYVLEIIDCSVKSSTTSLSVVQNTAIPQVKRFNLERGAYVEKHFHN